MFAWCVRTVWYANLFAPCSAGEIKITSKQTIWLVGILKNGLNIIVFCGPLFWFRGYMDCIVNGEYSLFRFLPVIYL